jgi:hypothetical protein
MLSRAFFRFIFAALSREFAEFHQQRVESSVDLPGSGMYDFPIP